jgi:hypothetical protein
VLRSLTILLRTGCGVRMPWRSPAGGSNSVPRALFRSFLLDQLENDLFAV